MTGYTVHTGSSDKFAAAWDRVFQEDAEGSAKGGVKKKTVVPAAKAGATKARRRAKGQTKRSKAASS